MPSTRLRIAVIPLLAALFFVAGCGRRTVTVSGTVELPEKTKVEKDDLLQIMFIPDDKEETKVPIAIYSRDDKTFVCKDILPGGKYKITVSIEPMFGSADAQKRSAAFADTNKKYDKAATKLTFQASDDSSQAIAIDLAKGTVTKK